MIDVHAKINKRKAKSTAPTVAVAAEPTAPKSTSTNRRGNPLLLVGLGFLAACLLMGAVGAVAAYTFLGGDGDNDDSEPSVVQTPIDESEGNQGNDESRDPPTNGEVQDPPGPDSDEPKDPGDGTGTDPAADPDGVTDPLPDPAGNSNGGTDPGTEPGTEPETDPGTNPETDPGTEPETDPGTEPETDPGTEPNGGDPPDQPNNGAGSNPNPTESEKAPDFRGLPGAIALPSLGGDGAEPSSEPIEIGRIQARQHAPWVMTLTGGKIDSKGGGEFVVQRKTPGSDKKDWVILFRVEAGEKGVARIWAEDDALNFQWLKFPTKAIPAQHVSSCVLNVDVDGEIRPVALRKPATPEPIAVDLTKKTIMVPVELDSGIDPKKVSLQLDKLSEAFGRYQIQPQTPVEAGKPIMVGVMAKDPFDREVPAVVFKVQLMPRRDKMNVQYILIKPLASVFASAQAAQGDPNAIAKKCKELKKKIDNDKTPRPEKQKAFTEINQQMMLHSMLWYRKYATAVHGKTKINYSIVTTVDNKPVVVAKSQAPKADEKKDGEEKNP